MELTPALHAFLWTSASANNCNTYLIRSEEKTILVDPGHAAYFDHVRRQLEDLGLSTGDIDLILCTHAHPDHIEAVRLFNRSQVPFALHEKEWQLVQEMAPAVKASTDLDLSPYRPDFFLREGDLKVGDVALDVYHTPGHSPGGTSIYWPAQKALFSGDLIFKDGVGRTDLPGGSGNRLKDSVRGMAALDVRWLLSGHGDPVEGEKAVKDNFDRVQRMWFGYI